MHILLIHQIFATPDQGGGVRHYELARFLVQRGHKATVIAGNVDYLTGRKKNKKQETKEGMQIIYSYTLAPLHKNFVFRGLSFLSFAVSSFINALKIKNVDMIWGTSPPLFQSCTAWAIARRLRKPMIYEVRDLWIDFAEELGIAKSRFLIRLLKFTEKKLYQLSDRIIINSPGFMPYVLKNTSEEKVSVIPNGAVPHETTVAKSLGVREALELDGKFIAVYLGNIGVANDIETIFKAAERLADINQIIFLIMGGGIKKVYFTEQIIQKGISNVVVVDAAPKSEIPVILANVDVCIATLKNIPLFKTTYPNKVFDYMAAGKPTVLAIDGVIREVIESADGGIFVEPGNDQQLSKAVLTYYRNPTLAKQHGANAQKYQKKHFDRIKIAEELERVLIAVRTCHDAQKC